MGNGVVRLSLRLARRDSSAAIERVITRVCSASNKCVRGAVTSERSASEQACEPNSGAFKPESCTEPVGETWYCTADVPDR